MARILVCEDSFSQALNLKLLLESVGHEVVVAENGQVGLRHLMTSAFDAVLLDVIMPEMGGFELCRVIRTQSQFASLPVILLTTLKEAQAIQRGQDVGANIYIIKPFDERDLLRRLERVLSTKLHRTATSAVSASAPVVTSVVPLEPPQVETAPLPPPQMLPAAPSQKPPEVSSAPTLPETSPAPSLPEGPPPLVAASSSSLDYATSNEPPSAPVQLRASSAPEGVAAAPGAKLTLLLVEPSDALRNVLRASLAKLYTVHAVNSAPAAIEVCSKGIDVLVAESPHCPSELVTAVRKSNPKALVLLLVDDKSSSNLPPDVAILAKPFTAKALLERLKELNAV